MEMTSRNEMPDRRTLVGLFSDLWRETSTLFRAEAELAKAEVSEKVSQVQTAIIALAAGGVILLAALLVLLDAAVNGLAQVLPPEQAPWLAPLIIGVIVAIIGFIALAKGRRDLQARNLTPARTMQSLRRDAELTREHLR
ncbi:MAG TPA: phage holin family protein [Burkholderiales bacterium]|nr:phage holin family protein [Burkholderiales bacterium]